MPGAICSPFTVCHLVGGVIQLQTPTQVSLSELLLALTQTTFPGKQTLWWRLECKWFLYVYRFIDINTLKRKGRKQDFAEGEDEQNPVSGEASAASLGALGEMWRWVDRAEVLWVGVVEKSLSTWKGGMWPWVRWPSSVTWWDWHLRAICQTLS